MVKIVTMCRQGLVRSVALADVLKLHFEPVDVLPIGYFGNSEATKEMLFNWADFIIVMQEKYLKYIREADLPRTCVCDVGPDVYGNAQHPQLISKVWDWVRKHQNELGIREHTKSL